MLKFLAAYMGAIFMCLPVSVCLIDVCCCLNIVDANVNDVTSVPLEHEQWFQMKFKSTVSKWGQIKPQQYQTKKNLVLTFKNIGFLNPDIYLNLLFSDPWYLPYLNRLFSDSWYLFKPDVFNLFHMKVFEPWTTIWWI